MRYADLPERNTHCKGCGTPHKTVPLVEASLEARRKYGSFGYVCQRCDNESMEAKGEKDGKK